MIDLTAELQFVASQFGKWTQRQIRDSLCPARSAVEALEIVSFIQRGSDHEWGRALWMVLVAKLVPGKARLEQRAAGEIVQKLCCREMCVNVASYRRRRGSEQRESLTVFVLHIVQQGEGQNVVRTQINLDLGQIAAAQERIAIRTFRKIFEDIIVVLSVRGIEKPDLTLLDRARNRGAWHPLVEAESLALFVLPGWDEVRSVKTKMVVAHPGVEVYDPTRFFPKLGGNAGAFNIDLPHRVRAEAHGEIAADRRSNVKAVEHISALVSIGPGNVNLPGRVLHYLREKGQQITDIARRGIGNVDDLGRAQHLAIGRLRRIDSLNRGANVHRLFQLLHMWDHDLERLRTVDCQILLGHGIEVSFLRTHSERAIGVEADKASAARGIGLHPQHFSGSCISKNDNSVRNNDTVFIAHHDRE